MIFENDHVLINECGNTILVFKKQGISFQEVGASLHLDAQYFLFKLLLGKFNSDAGKEFVEQMEQTEEK